METAKNLLNDYRNELIEQLKNNDQGKFGSLDNLMVRIDQIEQAVKEINEAENIKKKPSKS